MLVTTAGLMLAPLTNLQSHVDGTMSQDEFHWLTLRAQGGFGLTMTCAAHVQAVGQPAAQPGAKHPGQAAPQAEPEADEADVHQPEDDLVRPGQDSPLGGGGGQELGEQGVGQHPDEHRVVQGQEQAGGGGVEVVGVLGEQVDQHPQVPDDGHRRGGQER